MSKATVSPANISVTNATHSLGDLEIELTFGTVTNPSELSDSEGKVWYIVDDTHLAEKTVSDGAVIGSTSYTVDWAGNYTENQRIAAAGKTVKFTISADDPVFLIAGTGANRAAKVSSQTYETTITVEDDGSLSGDGVGSAVSVYFRVDGGSKTSGSYTDSGAGPVEGTITAA